MPIAFYAFFAIVLFIFLIGVTDKDGRGGNR
jgi:hypothetical protein